MKLRCKIIYQSLPSLLTQLELIAKCSALFFIIYTRIYSSVGIMFRETENTFDYDSYRFIQKNGDHNFSQMKNVKRKINVLMIEISYRSYMLSQRHFCRRAKFPEVLLSTQRVKSSVLLYINLHHFFIHDDTCFKCNF